MEESVQILWTQRISKFKQKMIKNPTSSIHAIGITVSAFFENTGSHGMSVGYFVVFVPKNHPFANPILNKELANHNSNWIFEIYIFVAHFFPPIMPMPIFPIKPCISPSVPYPCLSIFEENLEEGTSLNPVVFFCCINQRAHDR